jgi:hypothetical protein
MKPYAWRHASRGLLRVSGSVRRRKAGLVIKSPRWKLGPIFIEHWGAGRPFTASRHIGKFRRAINVPLVVAQVERFKELLKSQRAVRNGIVGKHLSRVRACGIDKHKRNCLVPADIVSDAASVLQNFRFVVDDPVRDRCQAPHPSSSSIAPIARAPSSPRTTSASSRSAAQPARAGRSTWMPTRC